MAPKKDIDVLENTLRKQGRILDILLIDRTTKKNILWATDSYFLEHAGNKAFDPKSSIMPELVTGKPYGNLIQPRAVKSLEEQKRRTKDKAEVFTPLHIVEAMNRRIDESMGYKSVNKDNWQGFVKQLRLEITCGEGPFLVGRYNPETHTGKKIELYTKRGGPNRVGFLDRKLYVVTKYCDTKKDWLYWSKEAFKSSYGYEWQGDNLLLARENLLYTFKDFYQHKFKVKKTPIKLQEDIADIISWNIFQMDGLKYNIPMSCEPAKHKLKQQPFLQDIEINVEVASECEGCKYNDPFKHTPRNKYVKIMDWQTGKPIRFVELLQ